MRKFLSENYPAFPPEQIEQLATAFDDAWTACVASGIVTDANQEELRWALGRRIVELASDGELDAIRLRDAAVASLGVPGSGKAA
jgi:hypothetical protein